MENNKILCPHCNHKPFRNETGLAWHLQHQHGNLIESQNKDNNQTSTAAPNKPEQHATIERPTAVAEKAEAKPEASEKQPRETTKPDGATSRGATYVDIERLLNGTKPQCNDTAKNDQVNFEKELSKFKEEIDDKLNARLQIITERDLWLSGRISKLEQLFKAQ